jgi:hypothetical protein
MMQNFDVAVAWAKEENAEEKTGHMYCRNGVLYSYGEHFPIAVWLNFPEQVLAWNEDRYSVTTGKHKCDALRAIRTAIGPASVIELSTGQMQKLARERDAGARVLSVIKVTKKPEEMTIDEVETLLRGFLKSKMHTRTANIFVDKAMEEWRKRIFVEAL